MKKIPLRWQQFFGALAIISIGWILFAFMVTPRLGVLASWYRAKYPESISSLDLIALVVAILLIGGTKLVLNAKQHTKDLSNRTVYLLVGVELAIYLIGLVMFLKWLGYSHTVDDAQVVLDWLHHFRQANPWDNPEWADKYMYANPQNLFLMLTYKLVEFVIGRHFFGLVIFFCVLHVVSVAITFATLKVLGCSNWQSLLTIQIFLAAIQVTLQAPIAYTDTLALFYTAIALYTMSRFVKLSSNDSARYWWLIATCVATVLAFLSKGTSLIMIIALVVYLAVAERGLKRGLAILPLIILMVGNLGWKQLVNQSGIYPDDRYGQPNTHYIMMGMSNTPIPAGKETPAAGQWQVGIYALADQAYSWHLFYDLKLSKKEIQKRQLAAYARRIEAMKPVQLIEALNNKVSVVWGSGDLKTTFNLARGVNNQKQAEAFFTDRIWGKSIYFVMTVVQLVLYLGFVLVVIKYYRSYNRFVLFGSVFLAGYFAFMLLWEVNPRYSIALFPINILMLGLYLAPMHRKEFTPKECELRKEIEVDDEESKL